MSALNLCLQWRLRRAFPVASAAADRGQRYPYGKPKHAFRWRCGCYWCRDYYSRHYYSADHYRPSVG